MKKIRNICAAAIYFSCFSLWAQPSICAKEPSPKQSDYRVVQLICDPGPEFMPYRYGDTALADADETLNDYYQVAYKRAPDKAALVAEQKAWLKKRNACQTKDCLNALYHHRIIELTFLFGDSELHRRGIFPVDKSPAFIAFKLKGLQNFDDGIQDYDLLGTENSGKYNNDTNCDVGSTWRLWGADVALEELCTRIRRFIKSTDGRSLSLIRAYDHWLVGGVLYDGSRLSRQLSEFLWGKDSKVDSALWSPFDASILRLDGQGALFWHYYVVRKIALSEMSRSSSFWERNRRYGTVKLGSIVYLADKSILTSGFRMNPITGELFEKTLLRRFTPTQVQQWISAWTYDYLSANPDCQSALATCPNKQKASEYLRTRFEAEMDRQFAQDAQ